MMYMFCACVFLHCAMLDLGVRIFSLLAWVLIVLARVPRSRCLTRINWMLRSALTWKLFFFNAPIGTNSCDNVDSDDEKDVLALEQQLFHLGEALLKCAKLLLLLVELRF